ncbi:uncharacterized protein BKA55DRAFT_586065 [Fusarium redolens]|uniref:Secreted protein n=1 Tax=Fusarium redolens TaxID=48865 RepID=A0A9P9JKE8_FUSRE|nr:uncharacterized protein BKA55DRAFT_586065 [Fusarium redolens]KAH7208419.1 hypothetical protein BKA55DRAFT_586065 [Fusarium redolens]
MFRRVFAVVWATWFVLLVSPFKSSCSRCSFPPRSKLTATTSHMAALFLTQYPGFGSCTRPSDWQSRSVLEWFGGMMPVPWGVSVRTLDLTWNWAQLSV